MYKLLVLFCAVSLASGENSTEVSQCKAHDGALPINTFIEECRPLPCNVPQLKDAVIHIDFKTSKPVQSMKTIATVYLPFGPFIVDIPYDLGKNAETCNSLTNATCPLPAGQLVQYTLRMPITVDLPTFKKFDAQIQVVDESSAPLLCLRVPLVVVPLVQ